MALGRKRAAIIGGGPAGILAAAAAAHGGCEVTLFERNEKLGKKLYITGKGRCNITNSADMDVFLRSTLRNPKFLYSAFNSFTNNDIIKLIESFGVATKVERGGRVFPVSDKSSDVLRALSRYVEREGVDIRLLSKVESIKKLPVGFKIKLESGEDIKPFDALIIATGGKSYPQTGSDGAGYIFAESLGHTIVTPKPSLVRLDTQEGYPGELAGLTLKNVTLTAFKGKKRIYEELGELLFTHTGISGPLVLTLSGYIADAPEDVSVKIDLKPALDPEQLDKRILRDFKKHTGKQLKNALIELLPSRLISVIIEIAGVEPTKVVDEITREERHALLTALKGMPLTISGTGGLSEAVVTRGGVSVKEVDPKTLESKLVPGLYFAGEVLDVDAQTGGFNLQIAYSTGYLAGTSCAKALREE